MVFPQYVSTENYEKGIFFKKFRAIVLLLYKAKNRYRRFSIVFENSGAGKFNYLTGMSTASLAGRTFNENVLI